MGLKKSQRGKGGSPKEKGVFFNLKTQRRR